MTTINLNKYMWAYKLEFTISILANFLNSIPIIAIPYLLGVLFDSIFAPSGIDVARVGFLCMVVIGTIILEGLLKLTSQFSSARANGAASAAIRSDVFIALQEKSHKFYDEEGSGDLVSRSIGDVAAIINYYQQLTQNFAMSIGLFLFTVGTLFFINVTFGIISLVAIPLMFFTIRRYQKRFTPIQLQTREIYGQMANTVTEYVDNAVITRIFAAKDKAKSKVSERFKELRDIGVRNQTMQGTLNAQTNLIAKIIMFFFFLIGGTLVINSQITVGNLISAVIIANNLQQPIQLMGQLGNFRAQYRASETRLGVILATKPHLHNGEIIVEKQDFESSIEFDNVFFGYNDKMVLKDVSLKIKENASVAILGASGSGKSALINLIPRFYDVNQGEIKLSGRNIREYDLKSLRRMVGFVDQETFLFSRTIAENIAFGKPEASMDEIVEVAKIAQIHEFIETLDNGYDTEIGERGVNLSGGQRQRLAIARALLYDPKIVIFDDSLSALDIKTEAKLQTALDELLRERTVIFVTQRLSTVSSTDLNIIMANGRIIEKGTHKELLLHDGVYTRLFETQVDGILDLSVIAEQHQEVMQ